RPHVCYRRHHRARDLRPERRRKKTLTYTLQPGARVKFHSKKYFPTMPPMFDNTSLELVDPANNVALHISVRRYDQKIVFNNKVNGSYGEEEVIPLTDVFNYEDATIEVIVQKKQFVINVDDETVKLFRKRGGGAANSVTYSVTNSLPAFEDPIQVAVVKTAAP
ncbi:hypothetical protein BKA62DRAFT_695890, partial [Auriculariales sp. MPI-PUGE-AT-0066]